tara:strand:- start:1114 stop:1968 length:855 start_codon:yes stop_codon:yes gene_type:complete
MANTLTYSESVEGWPSFYSYLPEWIIGTNNYLYTFQTGQLWRHNVNAARNNFYGTQFGASILTILNESPLQPKLFKTLDLHTNSNGWDVALSTDIQTGAFVDDWQLKEGIYYANISSPAMDTSAAQFTSGGNNTQQLAQRSSNGISNYQSAEVETVGGGIFRINLPANVSMNPVVCIGDIAFIQYTSNTTGWCVGNITAIGVNTGDITPGLVGRNFINVDSNTYGTFAPNFNVGEPTRYVYSIKNQVAESYGTLGNYCQVTLTITSTSNVELFSIGSEVMKSNP